MSKGKLNGEQSPGAEEAKSPVMGQNLNAVIEGCRPLFDKLDEIDNKREELNAQKAEIIAQFEAKGINRHAVKAARQYSKLDADKRNGWDLSYEVSRRALGLPIQGDMFVTPAAPDGEEASPE